jgi:hypothetical protein
MDSILLNINTHDLNITRTHDFEVRFDALQLDHNADYHIALVSYNIPYTWYNISVAQGNNQFRYSPNAGVNWYTVTVPDGNYGIDDLNTELQELISANGHAVDKIVFSGDYNSMRVDLEILEVAWRVDFQDANSNNFRNILGFNSALYSGAVNTIFRAENRANITNNIDSISINCSIVDTGSILLNNRQSSSLYHITDYGAGAGSYLTARVPYPVYLPINLNGNIHSIRISIRNQSDDLVDLNAENITISLHLKKM